MDQAANPAHEWPPRLAAAALTACYVTGPAHGRMVRVKDHLPRAWAGSVSVPATVQWPGLRRPRVLIAPAGDAMPPPALEGVPPRPRPPPPFVRKWPVNPAEAAAVVVAVFGPRWA